ncbi:hypothetical protein BGX27_006916 [Mortierella sp. AM989]|nr:hypothetical protein BGX27_006916 [Mortierella sp. AM989]
MTGQSQAQGSPALETSVQVALRIRPIVTDTRSQSKTRQRAETEVISLVERAPTPSSPSGVSGTGAAHDQPQQVAVVPLQRYFTFDQVFSTDATQEEVYRGSVKRMVDKFMEGYNVTIMAYGQTSSGKTYTMGTAAQTSESRGGSSEGIIPRAMTQLFQEAKKPPPVYPGYKVPPLKTTFRVSFVEIYNEDLIDLLVKGDFRPPVTIREDAKGNIYWTGVQEIVVSSVEEVIHLLWFGSQNRQTHSTEMNEKSSRSHAIFSITLRQEKFVPTHPPPPQSSSFEDGRNSPLNKRSLSKASSIVGLNGASTGMTASGRPGTPTSMTPSSIPTPFTSGIVAPGSKLRRQSNLADIAALSSISLLTQGVDDPEPEGDWIVLNSKFHFVDLAGSERLKRTSAIGDRAKEGISINAGLHALGNVISALGDPSKKASHIPYRDSKLTRLLQDSLGGNALALMIACVSPSELNLGETLNTLKYANRARNIKNSSSLNQEINMDNPEYLRSIIQKLKLEIRILKEAKNGVSSGMGDATRTSSPDMGSKAIQSHRYSIASTTTVVPGNFDDSANEDRAFSPSPSRRLSHHQSRESISTDISHLDAVQEEDGHYSDASSSARTAVMSTSASSSNGAIATPNITRSDIVPLIPASVESKSFQEFVEPVIEEYEKVISGLESHLAIAQAALSVSEVTMKEQQGTIDVLEKQYQLRMTGGSDSDEASTRNKQKELEKELQAIQLQLKAVEARKVQGDQQIQQLEQKLAQEQTAAQDIQKALKEKEEQLLLLQTISSSQSSAAKEQELKALTERIIQLEDQHRRQLEETEAEAESLRLAQAARAATPESDHDREEREVNGARHDQDITDRLKAKAELEVKIESEKVRHATLVAEIEDSRAPHVRTDSAHADHDHGDSLIKQLDVTNLLAINDTAQISRVKELEDQLAEARESERLLKDETTALTEKLDKLQKEQTSAIEMEEMLHLAVSDLEGRLKSSQENESKRQDELEQNLARIQDLEVRSTKAEQEALKIAEELTTKLAEAKAGAEARLADELLELLEKMEEERTKVEELQTQVENHLADLATEKSRAAELESARDAIQAQWNIDKDRILTLEKGIEEQSALVVEKAQLISSLEEKVSQHEGSLAAKLQLEQELKQRVVEHADALSSKAALILELEQKIQNLEDSLKNADDNTKEMLSKVEDELSDVLEQLSQSQIKIQEQELILEELNERVSTLDIESSAAKDILSDKEAEHAEFVQAVEIKLKIAETDRDDAETKLEEFERRHQAVNEEIKSLQASVVQHLATIDLLQSKLSEAQSPSPSRPVSMSSTAVSFTQGEDSSSIIQKLEKEKARYRELVRENEKEIERLNRDLETLISEFTTFEDAEDEMKARIVELEAMLEAKDINKPNNLSSTSLASINSNHSAHNRDPALNSSTAEQKAQLSSLKAERDQAVQSSEDLSAIVAELNVTNHSLQERLLSLEREQESLKLEHVLERQSLQEEIRTLKDRAERLDRNASPSPMGFHHDDDKERAITAHERILRHKLSSSSDHFANRGEDSLATPRQSWNTTTSASQQPSSQIRAGRHESTLILQAKQIKLLEERIAELQGSGGSPMSESHVNKITSSISSVGLGIQHKASDPELARPLASPIIRRQSSEKMSPSMRAFSTAAPSTPPPSVPLPPPPAGAAVKSTAHLHGNAPPSPRISGVMNLETSSPSSPSMRPSRAGSVNSRLGTNSVPPPAGSPSSRRERDSMSSNISENASAWASQTGISHATAVALEGVEVNELRGVVDTLAHQVQSLKVEQTMQQGKIQRLETALTEAEEKLKAAQSERATTLAEKESLTNDLEQVRAELAAAKVKSEKDRTGLEGLVERERREREKAMETRVIMEAKLEELMSRKSKFACF